MGDGPGGRADRSGVVSAASSSAARAFDERVRTEGLERPADVQGGSVEHERAADLLRELLAELGVPEDTLDDRRLRSAVDALRHMTRGYGGRPGDVIGDAMFDEAGDEPVIVRNIPFVSMCREHFLLFHGQAQVAYLPGEAVVGLSKLARLVDLFAHRLQTPTSLADQLAEAVMEGLGARGVAVRIEARQVCPGVSGTITSSAYLGAFRLPLWRGRLEAMR